MPFAAGHTVLCTPRGIHPHRASELDDAALDALAALAASSPRVRAIGEIGLDYHYDFAPRPVQREAFRLQLMLARELDLPVVIHDREAHGETLELLREFRPRGVVHCFSGSAEMAAEVVRLGMYVGFTGVVTFKNAQRPLKAAAAVPPERLLLETDCPYMAPEPYRGRRCDSSMIPFAAEVLAPLKSMSAQELIDLTRRNALQLLGIGNA
jgi:TatD DNase family protein